LPESHPAADPDAPSPAEVESETGSLSGADRAAAPATEIRSRALKLLTSREHSRLELARKLYRRGYPADAVDPVLDALEADGLLSEARLLAAYVTERLDKGFGPLRIRAELQAKGLSDAAIDPHLQLEDARCLSLMRVVDAGKFGASPPHDRQTLAKRARFLEYRGFPAHLIARVLDFD
jgi:regulatory protein